MNKNIYAERIKQIRNILELSVPKMAKKIEIPARTISSYERCERMPSIEFTAQLCMMLNIDANWFVNGEGEMFKKKPVQFEQVEEDFEARVEAVLKKKGIIL